MKFRDRHATRKRTGKDFSNTKSLTQQNQAAEADMTQILARAKHTGRMPVAESEPVFGDFSYATNLADALEVVAEAEEQFDQLPAFVRQVADNDPLEYFRLLHTEEGYNALVAAERKAAGKQPQDPPPTQQSGSETPQETTNETPASEAKVEGNPSTETPV